jgi:hypothetical protein
MALTDIFSTSFLICLGINVLLVGFLFIYINQKMADQNHKISSMLGLISTMAEELNYCRTRLQSFASFSKNSEGVKTDLGIVGGGNSTKLIEVSDGEDNDDTDDSDDEDADDDDEDDDSEDDDDDDEDDEDADDDENDADGDGDGDGDAEVDAEDINANTEINNGIRSINLGNSLEIQSTNLNELQSDDDLDDLDEMNLDDLDDNSDNEEMHIDAVIMPEITPSNEESITLTPSTNSNNLKTINISDLDELSAIADSSDYKKLSLNKLRSVVIEKGLSKDASKLKKPDLLKLLGAE